MRLVRIRRVRIVLEGLMYDVNRLLRDYQTKAAFELIKKKVRQIEGFESRPYERIDWDDDVTQEKALSWDELMEDVAEVQK